jgi:hypothetical protein
LLRALRRWHAWIGLWGAALGLLFGATGFLLNHRAVLKIPALQYERVTVQRALPAPPPASAAELESWLRADLGMEGKTGRVSVERSHALTWNGETVLQPEKWSIAFDGSRDMARAEYFLGNRFVKVERIQGNWLAALSNTHKANGANVGWVLLADTIAMSLIALSISGLLMWSLTRPQGTLVWGLGISTLVFAILTGSAML